MSLLSLYIFKRMLATMALVTFGLGGFAWLAQSLRLVDMVAENGLPVGDFVILSIMLLPSLLWVMIPIAFFVSLLIVMNGLARGSELVVMHSLGMSHMRVLRPAMLLAAMLVVLQIFIASYGMPASFRYFKDAKREALSKPLNFKVKPGVLFSPQAGVTAYIDHYDEGGAAISVFIDDRRGADSVSYTAQRAIYDAEHSALILHHGTRQQRAGEGAAPSILSFDSYIVDIKRFMQVEDVGVTSRSTKEKYITELVADGDGKMRTELHERLIWPLFPLVLVLIGGVAFMRYSRDGGRLPVVLSCIGAVFYVAGMVAALQLIGRRETFIPLPYVMSICIIIALLYVYNRKIIR